MSKHFIHGVHAVSAAVDNKNRKIKDIFVVMGRGDKSMEEIVSKAKARQIHVVQLDAREMKQKFAEMTHQGIVAEVEALPEMSERELPAFFAEDKPYFVLILDGVTDPHNLGACLRTADAAGVDCVIIPKDKNAPITSAVGKVACGALESVPIIRVTNLVRSMEALKALSFWIYGAAGEVETSLFTLEVQQSIAIVMGAEGKGLRRLTKEHCDGLFSIPMYGMVSSLNVSVATGLCLYEVVRKRRALARRESMLT